MSVKNTLDGSYPIAANSNITPTTLTYSGLITATYPSIYTKIGGMCILYLPSLTQTPTASQITPIQITVPNVITPTQSQIFHGFSVNDANGQNNCALQLVAGSNSFTLGIDGGSPPGGLNYTSPVSISMYRCIIYQVNE